MHTYVCIYYAYLCFLVQSKTLKAGNIYVTFKCMLYVTGTNLAYCDFTANVRKSVLHAVFAHYAYTEANYNG